MALAAPEGTEPLRLLVVEGSPTARRSLAALAEARGHAVTGAADADEAWTRLSERPVDVVLTDWCADPASALGLVGRLRTREADGAPYTAVVLVASASTRAALPAALASGADACVIRPVDAVDIEAALGQAARIVRLERRLRDREELVRQQEEILREEVRRDPVTQLGNRLRLDEDLRRFRSRAARYGHRAAAVLLGVDHARRYAEAEGRTAGDELLRRVAAAVRTSMRGGDAAYRYTGDRLLLLLPEQDEEGALVAAERCRAAVAALRLPHPRSDAADTVTLSAGVSSLEGTSRDAIDAWLLRAEQALDAACAAGGDRVVHGARTRVPGPGADA